MGNTPSAKEDRTIIVPDWIHTVRFTEKYYKDSLITKPTGFKNVNHNTIVRINEGNNKTDGARWSRPFSKGKHIFEIAFPTHMRGKHATVGIGTKNAKLFSEKDISLVGSEHNSWGIDLKTKSILHNGKNLGKYPSGFGNAIPDRFYMYVDLDAGNMMFGADGVFWGPAFQDADFKGEVIYMFVSATTKGATITVVYRGKGMVMDGPIRKKRKL